MTSAHAPETVMCRLGKVVVPALSARKAAVPSRPAVLVNLAKRCAPVRSEVCVREGGVVARLLWCCRCDVGRYADTPEFSGLVKRGVV